MPASTPNGYPYPLGTEAVAQGDDAIHALASAVDRITGGTVTIATVNNGASGTAAVTFPVGMFTVAPDVFVIPVSPNWWGYLASAPTTSGVTIGIASYVTRATVNISTYWHCLPRG